MAQALLPSPGRALRRIMRRGRDLARRIVRGRRCARCGQPFRLIWEEIEEARDYVVGRRVSQCVYCLKIVEERLAYGPVWGIPH
ncbi:MAG TPA: hypothetical protein VHL09_09270 [Dehalococcoidia bacterium]|nr:hypothetical protein [Dehalococcoidia bacterium]